MGDRTGRGAKERTRGRQTNRAEAGPKAKEERGYCIGFWVRVVGYPSIGSLGWYSGTKELYLRHKGGNENDEETRDLKKDTNDGGVAGWSAGEPTNRRGNAM